MRRPQHVRISIHDVLGRLAARVADGRYPAGRHVAEWQGRDRNGRAAPGIYFVRIDADGRMLTRRIVFMP